MSRRTWRWIPGRSASTVDPAGYRRQPLLDAPLASVVYFRRSVPVPLIARIVVWASRRRAAVLVGVACLLLASVGGVRRLSFDADILSLLPQHGRVIPAFREFLSRFGTLDQLYVVFTAAEGHGIDEYRDEIDAWIEQLRRAPEIAGVEAGVIDRSRDFGWLARRQLLLLHPDALDEALRRLEPDGLAHQVARSRELLTLPSADVAELVRQDPAGLLMLLRPTSGGADTGPNAAATLDAYVTADGRSRVVIARPRRPPYDADFSRALDQRLRAMETTLSTGARCVVLKPGMARSTASRIAFCDFAMPESSSASCSWFMSFTPPEI